MIILCDFLIQVNISSDYSKHFIKTLDKNKNNLSIIG